MKLKDIATNFIVEQQPSASSTRINPNAPYENVDTETLLQKKKYFEDKKIEITNAISKSYKITKAIKHDDTVSNIIVEFTTLAETLDVDKDTLRYALDDVYKAKNALESAVFGLDEVFKDRMSKMDNAIQLIDDELNEREEQADSIERELP